jgi:hypothetical protein
VLEQAAVELRLERAASFLVLRLVLRAGGVS